MMASLTSIIILSLLALVEAATLTGSISFASLLGNAGQNVTIPVGSKVLLDHGAASGLISSTGGFKLYNVDEGEHIITAHVHGWAFPSSLVTVPPTGEPHVQIHHPGKLALSTSSPSLRYPIVLSPLGKEDYYSVKSGVNILGMLKSPLILMMLASGVMMFVLPKVMASVEADPELKKEMADARRMLTGKQKDLGNMLKGSGSSGIEGPPSNGAWRRK